jgi:hypothetical protein
MVRFWLSTSLKEDMMSSVSIFCGDVLVVSLSSVSSTRSIIGCDDDATEDFFFVLVTILIFKKGDNKEIMLKNFIHRRQDGESQTNVILLTHMIYLIYNTLLAEYCYNCLILRVTTTTMTFSTTKIHLSSFLLQCPVTPHQFYYETCAIETS